MQLSMMSMTVLLHEGLNALYEGSDWQLPLSLQNALFFILVGITLTITIQYIMCLYLMLL